MASLNWIDVFCKGCISSSLCNCSCTGVTSLTAAGETADDWDDMEECSDSKFFEKNLISADGKNIVRYFSGNTLRCGTVCFQDLHRSASLNL